MVGGIADWFAVTALFRHPLGLPIPHTAIIPRNKDRIGDTLAAFLRDNFLTPSVVARRMRRVDVAGAIGRFLAQPPRRGPAARRARRGCSPTSSRRSTRSGSAAWSRPRSPQRMRAIEVAPLLGQTLEAAITEDRHVPMVDGIVTWAGRTLDANEDLIRDMVHERAGWILRLAGLDEKLADAIVDGLRQAHHRHGGRSRSSAARQGRGRARAARLRACSTIPRRTAKVEAWKNEMIDNKAVTDWLGGLWENSRAGLLKRARAIPTRRWPASSARRCASSARRCRRSRALKRAINQFARRAAVGAVASYGDGIVTLVSETVRGWDARTVTDRLEGAVGRDLQYIRINGTLVGGLVGLAHPHRRGAVAMIETDRLFLRPQRIDDFEQLHALTASEEVHRHLGGQASIEDNYRRLLAVIGGWSVFGFDRFALFEREGGAFVGACGIFRQMRGLGEGFDGYPEAGWIISADRWGRGYASEAMPAVIDWFERTQGPQPTVCMIVPENLASARIAAKLGYNLTRTAEYKSEAINLYRRDGGLEAGA